VREQDMQGNTIKQSNSETFRPTANLLSPKTLPTHPVEPTAPSFSKLTKTSDNAEYHVPAIPYQSSAHACQPDAHQNQKLEIF
jgi:hypothetical protein